MKVVSDTSDTTINVVKYGHNTASSTNQSTNNKPLRECWNCGCTHEYHKKELCLAYGKTYNKCQKLNHFAVKCRSKVRGSQRHVKALDRDDPDEVFPTEVSTMHLDDSQYVTLKLESGNYLRFQADTGAQSNVIPLSLYKKETKTATWLMLFQRTLQ